MPPKKKNVSTGQAQQILIGLMLLAIIIGVVFYMFFYQDWQTETLRVQQNLIKVNEEVRKQETALRDLDRVEREAACLLRQLSTLNKQLPSSSDDLNEFLDAIDARATSVGLHEIRRFEQLDIEGGELYDRVPIRMDFVASYDAATNFFWELSRMGATREGNVALQGEQVVNISDLEISRPDRLASGLVQVSCQLETYLYSAELAEEERANAAAAAGGPR